MHLQPTASRTPWGCSRDQQAQAQTQTSDPRRNGVARGAQHTLPSPKLAAGKWQPALEAVGSAAPENEGTGTRSSNSDTCASSKCADTRACRRTHACSSWVACCRLIISPTVALQGTHTRDRVVVTGMWVVLANKEANAAFNRADGGHGHALMTRGEFGHLQPPPRT